MSILGKILAFLNILGAGGFLCLAAMVIGKQKAWEYANLQHDLVIKGLPLNEGETNRQGESIAENLGEPTLQGLFPRGDKVKTQLDEVKRVRQVLQGALNAAEADKKLQMVLYARYLLPLAESNAEREKLISVRQNLADEKKAEALKAVLAQAIGQGLKIMIPDPKKRSFQEAYLEAVRAQPGDPKDPFAEAVLRVLFREGGKKPEDAPGDPEGFLQAVRNEPGKPFAELFAAVFDEALEAVRNDSKLRFEEHFLQAADGKRRVKDPNTKQDAARDLLVAEAHKRAVAHLLFNLVEVMPVQGEPQRYNTLWENPAYGRVITVVGVQAIGKEIEARALALRAIATDLNLAITREQTAFVLAHQTLIDHLKDRAGHLEVQNALLVRRKEMADEKEKIVVRRKEDVAYFTKELDDARQETNDRMKELREMSKELYKIRIQVRDATRLNQEYERQINALEDRVR